VIEAAWPIARPCGENCGERVRRQEGGCPDDIQCGRCRRGQKIKGWCTPVEKKSNTNVTKQHIGQTHFLNCPTSSAASVYFRCGALGVRLRMLINSNSNCKSLTNLSVRTKSVTTTICTILNLTGLFMGILLIYPKWN
jgi:hypothetical protein